MEMPAAVAGIAESIASWIAAAAVGVADDIGCCTSFLPAAAVAVAELASTE